MTSEHVPEVIDYIDSEEAREKTKWEILKEFQDTGFLDSKGNYTAPYRHLGWWIDECTQLKKNTAIDAIEFEEC